MSAALALYGCNGDGSPPSEMTVDGGCEVLADAPLDCTATFEPADYAAIYDNVIARRCGSSDVGCHGSDSPSGLELSEPDSAHAALLGATGGPVYVVPGHPECSELIHRVQSSDRRVRMPLNGDPLDDGLICAMRHWIADGAEGP